MNQKIFVLALGAMLLALCSFANAQQTGKIFRTMLALVLGVAAEAQQWLGDSAHTPVNSKARVNRRG
jgi:hypothetical protein